MRRKGSLSVMPSFAEGSYTYRESKQDGKVVGAVKNKQKQDAHKQKKKYLKQEGEGKRNDDDRKKASRGKKEERLLCSRCRARANRGENPLPANLNRKCMKPPGQENPNF